MSKVVTGADFGPLGNKLATAMGAALLAGALALTLWAAWGTLGIAHDVWRARHWPSTQATVLHASMISKGEPRRLGFYPTRVKFRHVESGREYESGRLIFTGQETQTQEIWNGQWTAKIVEYLENARLGGRPVQLFVNPADAGDAVLFRDLPWGNYLWRALAASAAGLAFTFGCWLYLRRRLARRGAKICAYLLASATPLITLCGAFLVRFA